MDDKTQARRPLYLLVADDERDTVQTLGTILSDEGHEVVGMHKGPTVIEQVRRRKPDAVILDIDMPGMSGYSVAREVRATFEMSPPLLIAISGKWVGQTDRMLADLAGFSHFLQKPCDPQILLALLEPLRQGPASSLESTLGRAELP
jgi:DNA-binding response OmpR family regulator